MGDIPNWIDTIAGAYLQAPEIMDDASGDPFWYLWAAPYVSTVYPKAGGSEQLAR